MRRLMLTLAVVFVLAVVEVKAQGHGVPATPAAKAPATPPAKADTPAPTPPDLATVMERINKQVGTEVSDVRNAKPTGKSVPAGHPAKSAAPQAASRVRAATPTHSRVELDWRTPLLVWPEELLRPEVSSSR